MTDLLSPDVLTGGGLALAAAGAVAGVRWLVSAKAKQLDSFPDLIHQVQMELVRMAARLERAEADIANDKAGRRAFAGVEMTVNKISTDVMHLAADLQKLSDRQEKGGQELWAAVDRLREAREGM